MGVPCAPFRDRNNMTIKIVVDIVVPPEFAPPNDGDFDRYEQVLTSALVDYFPKLIIESCNTISYLNELDFEIDDISASHRVGVEARSGYIINVHVYGTGEPGQQTWVDMRSELSQAVLRWFNIKNHKSVRIALYVDWPDDS